MRRFWIIRTDDWGSNGIRFIRIERDRREAVHAAIPIGAAVRSELDHARLFHISLPDRKPNIDGVAGAVAMLKPTLHPIHFVGAVVEADRVTRLAKVFDEPIGGR